MPTLHCPDPRCRHEYRVPAGTLGATVRCPACGRPHTARVEAAVEAAHAAEQAAIASGERGEVVPLALALVSVRSLWNVGSLFRTADGLGLERVELLGFTATPENPRMARTARGAEQVVPWKHHPDPVEALRSLAGRYQVIALETGARARSLEDVPLRPPVLLVLGNEVVGLGDDALALCDEVVEVPMYGAKRSLNVAVAGGIAGYALADRLRRSLSPGRSMAEKVGTRPTGGCQSR